MKWSWRIGRLAGVDLYLHATFVLFLLFLAFSFYLQTRSWAGTLHGLAVMLLLFASVLLHEYGHALAARRLGIATRDITLLPIGGVARLERLPEKPLHELWVALAGPLVNLLIAAAVFLFLGLTQGPPSLALGFAPGASLGERLLAANLALAVFNMLPAFPMDGGRVLRALLALGGDFLRATQVAAAIGQGMALLFAFFGLLTNPMLLFVALFVWIGAQQEATAVQMRNALSGIPVRRTMITDFRTLAPEDTLEKAVEYLLATSQQDFPVVREGQVVGVLTRGDLLRALSQRDEQVPVETVMQRDFTPVHPNEMLEAALARLEACQCHTFPVVEGGRLVGILTTENVGEYLMLVSAMERRKAQRRMGGEVAPA